LDVAVEAAELVALPDPAAVLLAEEAAADDDEATVTAEAFF